MLKNIGWLYNKQYFERLYEMSGDNDDPDQYNQELLNLNYKDYDNEFKFLKDIWQKECDVFSLKVCYPGLVTGVGMNHQTGDKDVSVSEYKLGFYFDYTTGMPAIPGASVKGALRDMFPGVLVKDRSDSEQEGLDDASLKKLEFNEEVYKVKIRYIAHAVKKIQKVEQYFKEKKQADYEYLQDYVDEETKNRITNGLSKEELNELEKQIETAVENEITTDEELERMEEIVRERIEKRILIWKQQLVNTYFKKNSRTNRQRENLLDNYKRDLNKKFRQEIASIAKNSMAESYEISKEDENLVLRLEKEIFMGINDQDKPLSVYDRDIFMDALLMGGHSDFFFLKSDYITPHKSPFKDPLPIQFLKLAPESTLKFFFKLKDGVITAKQKLLLFKVILLDRGIGAKTNVGYGQFSE